MTSPWRRERPLKKYPVPEKWAGMWNTIAQSIDDAQKWSMEAHKAKNENKVRLYSKMTCDRVQAMGNLMRLAFGDFINSISEERALGGKKPAVHTGMEMNPAMLVVYDTDEEYYQDVEQLAAEGKDGVAMALGFTSLNAPTKPLNPEGLD